MENLLKFDYHRKIKFPIKLKKKNHGRYANVNVGINIKNITNRKQKIQS